MIKLTELIKPDSIFLDVPGQNTEEALSNITRLLVEAGLVATADQSLLLQKINEREKICSTAVGLGAAIPHAYFDKLPQPMVVVSRLQNRIDYCGPDEEPVDLVFLLLGPKRDDTQHIQILSKIVRMIKDKKFDQDLRAAKTPTEAMSAVQEVEKRHH